MAHHQVQRVRRLIAFLHKIIFKTQFLIRIVAFVSFSWAIGRGRALVELLDLVSMRRLHHVVIVVLVNHGIVNLLLRLLLRILDDIVIAVLAVVAHVDVEILRAPHTATRLVRVRVSTAVWIHEDASCYGCRCYTGSVVQILRRAQCVALASCEDLLAWAMGIVDSSSAFA